MKKLLLAGLLALLSTSAHASCSGIFAPNTYCGNNSGTSKPPFQISGATSIVGPGSSTVGDFAIWNNITGSALADKAPSALTKTDDTNITVTLGGSAAIALFNPASITMGWTGTLAAARLNANVVQAITNDTNVTGSIAAQNLTLGWSGTLASTRLNANVVQSIVNDTNVTGSISAQALTFGWTGTLAVARGGTGAATQSAAAINLLPTPTNIGDVLWWNGTIWDHLAGNTSGTQFLSENASGIPTWVTVSGTGTVTSTTPGGGLVTSTTADCSQTAITTSGTISAATCVNAQSGTTYAILDADRGKLITATNAAAQAYTIAQADTASNFFAGWYTNIQNNSASGSAGIVTITATTSTIKSNGVAAATLKIYPGQSGRLVSDGTNYIWVAAGGSNWVLLNTLTASASVTLADTTSLTSAFNEYEIVFENLITSTSNSALILLAHSGGAFQNTTYVNSTGTIVAGSFVAGPASTTSVLMANVTQNTILPGLSGTLHIYAPSSAATTKHWLGNVTYNNTSSGLTSVFVEGLWNGGNGAIDGFQLCYSTTSPTCVGNIASGTVKVYGRI